MTVQKLRGTSGEVKDLNQFIMAIIELLELTDQCGAVLFRATFHNNLHVSLDESEYALKMLKDLAERKEINCPESSEKMINAGLYGEQLNLKLESFSNSVQALREEGGIDNLEEALDKANTILGSIVGAIPGVGSLAQELIDFILKELKKTLKFWRK
jgi:hypothetical protein